MKLTVRILTDLTMAQAKLMNRSDDALCVRQATSAGERSPLKKLNLRLGTDPVRDAATLASCLWGRKRHAQALYLFVRYQDLDAMHDAAYVAALQIAFGRCTRRSPSADFMLFLIPCDALALAV